MSGTGQKESLGLVPVMSAPGGNADIAAQLSNVCF
jgi:hypothetical protein